MGKTLEDINIHSLSIATDAPYYILYMPYMAYTFKRCDNSGKSTIDLTLTRGLKNVKVKTTTETIKTEHQAIEINTEGKDETIISNPKFKTKNANGAEWKESLKPYLEDYLEEFPTEITEEEIDNQTKKLTDVINNATLFFGQTESIKKEQRLVEKRHQKIRKWTQES